MKLAIVNDDLIQSGGQELVLEALLDSFPEADLYCSVISKKWKEKLSDRKNKYVVSFLDKFPFIDKLSRYYAPFLLHNLAYESFNFDKYDVVLSTSSRFSHHIITKPNTFHICYMHSPPRMLWQSQEYFRNESFGLLSPIKNLGMAFLSVPLAILRMLDYVAAQRVDFFLGNSTTVAKRIQRYYNREAQTFFPFVPVVPITEEPLAEDYYMVITRLAPWKRVDIAVEACLKLGKKLIVVGGGPDLNRLRKIAGQSPLISFLGPAPDSDKLSLLSKAIALIQTQREDFGIVPIEANAFGKPVICFGEGGVLDTMIEGKTAVFFKEQKVESLVEILSNFNPGNYLWSDCVENSRRFSKPVFQKNILSIIENQYEKYRGRIHSLSSVS